MTDRYGFEQADSIAARMDGVPLQLLEAFLEKYLAERRFRFRVNHGLILPVTGGST